MLRVFNICVVFLLFFYSPVFGEKIELGSVNSNVKSQCEPSSSKDIEGRDIYVFCEGDNSVTLNVSSSSIESPLFFWYSDLALTNLVHQGDSYTVTNLTSNFNFYVAVIGNGICKTPVGDAKVISIKKDDVLAPILPKGTSYFAPQGFGVDVLAEYPVEDSDEDFEFVWFDSDGNQIDVTNYFIVNSELPRGTYTYSVVARNTITGCSSPHVAFTVLVEAIEIAVDDCNIAGSSTISSRLCVSCDVLDQDNATDNDLETYSEIVAVKNVFAGGFIGQNLIFPVVGNYGDSVKVFLSFPDSPGKFPDLSSISLSLYNGTKLVCSEYFLNSSDVQIQEIGGKFSFTFLADLFNKSDEYVSVLIKSYSSLPSFVSRVAVHSTEMIFAVPNLPSDPVEVCIGNSQRLVVTPGENTFLRWYSEKEGGVELGSGSGFTTPALNTPGTYTYWIAVFRSNCESPTRYPYSITVKPPLTSSDLVVSGAGFTGQQAGYYCFGDLIELKPGTNPSGNYSDETLQFEWFIDPLGSINVKNSSFSTITVSPVGTLIFDSAQPGFYSFYLSAVTDNGCRLGTDQLKKVEFQVGPELPAPTFSDSSFLFCLEANVTLKDLEPLNSEFGIRWYADESRSVQLASDTKAVSGVKYYAVAFISENCESLESTIIEVQLISCAPKLRLNKQAELDPAFSLIAGNEITYSITIANDGIYAARDLQVKDVLPSGTSYVSSFPAANVSGDEVSWQLDSLAGGEIKRFELRLRVSPSFTSGTFLRNTATVSSEDVAGGMLEAEAEGVLVTRNASLGISKELLQNGSVYPGDTVRYMIQVWNSGPSVSEELVIIDRLEEELVFISAASGDYDAINKQVNWRLSSLSPGDTLSFELLVRVADAVPPGLVNNSAFLEDLSGNEKGSDSAEGLEVIFDDRIDLTLKKYIIDGEVRIGSEFKYGIYLKNTGSKELRGLIITDSLSNNLEYLSSDKPPISVVDKVLTWEIPIFASGDSVLVEVLVSLKYDRDLIGSQLVNTIWVNSVIQKANWSSSVESVILPPSQTELTISKKLLQETAALGEVISYELEIQNIGNTTAFEVVIKDIYPNGLQYIGFQGPGLIEVASDSLMIQLDKVLPGERMVIQIDFILIQFEKEMINVAELSSANAPDQIATAEPIKLTPVDVEVAKSVSNKFVEVGTEFSYKIRVVNNSDVAATDVLVIDFLPDELEFVNHTSSLGTFTYIIAERKVEWVLSRLEPKDSVELEIIAKAIEANINVVNTVSVSSFEDDFDESNNLDTVSHAQFIFHIPNVFTPNGDGINDTMEITGLELFPENSIWIFNRWGSLVFTESPYSNQWTGGDLVEGTYFYLFRWKDSENNNQEKSSFIQLMR